MRNWTRALLLLCLSACAGGADDSEASGEEGTEGTDAKADATELDPTIPVLAIENGVTVRGAGPNQQWEGIVMTLQSVGRGMGSCSASFITDRHIVTAAHCYGKDGAQRVQVRAPTWGSGWQTFERAVVRRASTNNSIDIAVVDLGGPVAWATPQRRFLLNAGPANPTTLHVYGYGAMSEAGGSANGTLRAAPGNATISIRDNGAGYLVAAAQTARVCSGDSGGPALKQGTAAVLWGINQSFTLSFRRSLTDRQPICPENGAQMRFTNVSANLRFIESTLGKTCKRLTVDGQQVAQCW